MKFKKKIGALSAAGVLVATVIPSVAFASNDGVITIPEHSSDKGFIQSPLIQNFDIKNEESKVGYKYLDKVYGNVDDVLKAWTSNATKVADTEIKKAFNVGAKIVTSHNGDVFTIDLIGEGQKSYLGGELKFDTLEKLVESFAEKVLQTTATRLWSEANQVEHILIPGADSIDSVIYSEAHNLKNSIPVNEDSVYINKYGGSLLTGTNQFKLYPYTNKAPFKNLVAEFRPGDSIVFAFDHLDDLASFTQRVKYDNTSDVKNFSTKVGEETIHYQQLAVINGEIVSDYVTDSFLGTNISIFSLKAVANNAVELTFKNPFADSSVKHLDAQLLYLNGFIDNDKSQTFSDKTIQMVGPFTVDENELYSSYATDEYIKKDSFIAGYDQAKNIFNNL